MGVSDLSKKKTIYTSTGITQQARESWGTPISIVEGMTADFLKGLRRGFSGKIFPPKYLDSRRFKNL